MLHSHTQFCDGHATMEQMASAAYKAHLSRYGFSPHSPIIIPSPCNMKFEDVDAFISEADRLKVFYTGKMEILKGMEIDYLSPSWGPHSEYFRSLPLDYRIGSVHFVPNQQNEFIDCDGNPQRFSRYLTDYFQSDLHYVVDKYFNQVKEMICCGGFDILGHFDKIAANASFIDPHIENSDLYYRHISEIIGMANANHLTIEINTKAFLKKERFFPALRWWKMLKDSGAKIIINSDAHDPGLVDAGISVAGNIYNSL